MSDEEARKADPGTLSRIKIEWRGGTKEMIAARRFCDELHSVKLVVSNQGLYNIMALLCFVVDASRLQGAVLGSIQQCLLRLANLAVLRSHRSGALPAIESIGLCAIKFDPGEESYKLEIVFEPRAPFSYRDFHYAVVNGLTAASAMSQEGTGQVSSLSSLLSSQWSPETATKRIVVITNCFCEPAASFRQAILEAAARCIMIDFIELDLSDHTNDQCLYPQPKLTGEFHVDITEFENCTFQRLQWNSANMSRLVKEWLQELGTDDEGSLEGVLCFQSPLLNSTRKIFCTLYPAVLRLHDVIKPCQACRCHGLPLGSILHCKRAICPVTGSDLDDHDLARSCLQVGEDTVMQMPSLVAPPEPGAAAYFHVIGSVYLALLSESVLFGMPYVVVSSSEADIELNPGGAVSTNNDHVFAALCQELHSKDTGLLCKSDTDIETGCPTSFICFYILLPSQNGSLLAKRIATSEELLPFPPAMRTPTSVPDDVRDMVSLSLSKMEAQSYDPLQHERGCDSKLSNVVSESLQFRSSAPEEISLRPNKQFVTATAVLAQSAEQPIGRLRKNLHNVLPRQQNSTTQKPSLPLNASQVSKGRSRKTKS
ncbi:hypothetical protein SELMODRAFT_415953 [Selaginella moellendorffii]|uniref:Uncharacterized protein n=1 Tax=Selaginella moellendorffii TaxID=88036 RepID=D8RXM4_SELML|nr:hypothetical protein SELMODRAFT_415953 [Selaginella moellendorffii]